MLHEQECINLDEFCASNVSGQDNETVEGNVVNRGSSLIDDMQENASVSNKQLMSFLY